MPRQLFSRTGMTVRVPISPTSGATKFATAGKIPMDLPDLTFMFVNRLPCDVRLEGFATEAAFQSVTEDSGWPILARSTMGVFTSKRPAFMSAQAFASPGLPLPVEGQDGWAWANCYLELIYGRGE
jgi:hypothetical protein